MQCRSSALEKKEIAKNQGWMYIFEHRYIGKVEEMKERESVCVWQR